MVILVIFTITFKAGRRFSVEELEEEVENKTEHP